MHQFVYFGIVIIENSVYFIGDYIFSNMAGPLMDNALNHYQTHVVLGTPFPGQTSNAAFTFDFRNTRSPFIGDGFMDSYITGELIYRPDFTAMYHDLKEGGHGTNYNPCVLEPDYMSFVNNDVFSQVVISESAFSCMINSFSQSPIGRLHFNNEKIKNFFGMDDLEMTTSFLASQIPLFEEKLGPDVELNLYLHMKDVKVLLGQYDSDIILEYTLVMDWQAAGGIVLLDELRMISSMDMKSKNDIMFITLLNHKLDVDSKFGQKTMPVKNNMELTENEYREFLSTFGFTMSFLKQWLNEVYFRPGLYFPYNIHEFLTEVTFQEKSMHILLEVEEEAEEFLEEEFEEE